MRLGEGVSLYGIARSYWGCQGRGVCGDSKWHGGVIEEIGYQIRRKRDTFCQFEMEGGDLGLQNLKLLRIVVVRLICSSLLCGVIL